MGGEGTTVASRWALGGHGERGMGGGAVAGAPWETWTGGGAAAQAQRRGASRSAAVAGQWPWMHLG